MPEPSLTQTLRGAGNEDAFRPTPGLGARHPSRVTDPEPRNHSGAGILGRREALAPPHPAPCSSGLRDRLRGPGAGPDTEST